MIADRLTAEPTALASPGFEAGRRYAFKLASGRVWCGTLCHGCDKLIVLTGALELTELRQKSARAFFRSDVLTVAGLTQ